MTLKIDWAKLMPNVFADYDETRYYFKEGDILTLSNYANVLITRNGINEFEILVLKSGFGMKKGELCTILSKELPFFKKGEFVSLSPQVKTNPFHPWETGDIVEDRGHLFALLEESSDKKGFTSMLLKAASDSEHLQQQIGARFYVPYR